MGKTSNNKIDPLRYHQCPLTEKVVCIGECYDIQMIRIQCVNTSVLNYEFDRKKANKLCVSCSFNQLTG